MVHYPFPIKKRYYLGTIRNGKIKIGDKIKVLPSDETNTVKRLFFYKNNLKSAVEGQAIGIELKKDLDISRGDLIIKNENHIKVSYQFEANIIWVDKKKAYIGRSYYMKIGYVLKLFFLNLNFLSYHLLIKLCHCK